jgi:hypothetical protein
MTKVLNSLLVLHLLLSGGYSFAQQAPYDALAQNLENSRIRLEQVEASTETSDIRLVEPLQQLAEALIDMNLYAEAHIALDRAIQIARIDDGLFTPRQRGLQIRKIENLIYQGDWGRARQDMEHLTWLYINKSDTIDEELVNDFLYMSELHIRGVGEDVTRQQSTHFFQAANLNWVALNLAKAAWGDFDPRLNRIMYSLVKQYYTQMVALERGGRTGYELRAVVPGSSWVRKRKDVKRTFYLLGARLLQQIKDIHSNAEPPDLEGIALADVYIGDWHVLFSESDEAKSSYSAGYSGLQAAAVDQARIDEFFENPVMLPEVNLFASVDTALLTRAGLQEGESILELDPEPESLQYSEWSSTFPHIRSPVTARYAAADEADKFALFSFSLSGLSGYSRWVNGSYRKAVSMALELQLLNSFAGSRDEEKALLHKVQTIRFRPTFVDGEAQSTGGTLRYKLATALPIP